MSEWCDHILTTTYSRPWRRLFRKTYWLRCWYCNLRVEEPHVSCRKVGHHLVRVYGDGLIHMKGNARCTQCGRTGVIKSE
jgi:hypothetical protein